MSFTLCLWTGSLSDMELTATHRVLPVPTFPVLGLKEHSATLGFFPWPLELNSVPHAPAASTSTQPSHNLGPHF